jgi:hypothetical protein
MRYDGSRNFPPPAPAPRPRPHLLAAPGQQHVGAIRCPDGWEAAHWGPGFYKPYGIWAEEHATATAYALYCAWSTVQQITPSQMRSLLEFFQPRPEFFQPRPAA